MYKVLLQLFYKELRGRTSNEINDIIEKSRYNTFVLNKSTNKNIQFTYILSILSILLVFLIYIINVKILGFTLGELASPYAISLNVFFIYSSFLLIKNIVLLFLTRTELLKLIANKLS